MVIKDEGAFGVGVVHFLYCHDGHVNLHGMKLYTHKRVHPWRIHFDVRQNQYNIVKLKKKNPRENKKERNGIMVNFHRRLLPVTTLDK